MSNFNSVFENQQKGTERWNYHHVCTRSKAQAAQVHRNTRLFHAYIYCVV